MAIEVDTGGGTRNETYIRDNRAFELTLKQPEFSRFKKLPDQELRRALATAYLMRTAQYRDYDVQLVGAYIDHFVDGMPIAESASEYGIKPAAIERLARDMPDYLAARLPASIWKGTKNNRSSQFSAVPFDVEDTRRDQLENIQPDYPITIGALATKQLVDIPAIDHQLTLVPEHKEQLAAFDPAFDFFDASELLELDDHEWKVQGEAMFRVLAEVEALKPDQAKALWSHIAENTERTKPVTFAIEKLARLAKTAGHSADKDKIKASWVVAAATSKKKSTSMIDEFRIAAKSQSRQTIDLPDNDATKCIALGLIRRINEMNLSSFIE